MISAGARISAIRNSIVRIAIVVFCCIWSNQVQADEPASLWDSPKIAQLRKDWRILTDAEVKNPRVIPGDTAERRSQEVDDLFSRLMRNTLTDEDVRQLARTVGVLPIQDKHWNSCDRQLIEFIAENLVYSEDRESLVKLFSIRFPNRIGPQEATEHYIAKHTLQLNDPILIFFEAYSKCQDPTVRREIVSALRRSFLGFGIVGADDAEFIKNALQWYQINKGRLSVKDGYIFNDWAVPGIEQYKENPERYDKPGFGLFSVAPSSAGTNSQKPESHEPIAPAKIVDWEPPKYLEGSALEQELAKLEGTWKMVEVISYGKTISPEQIAGGHVDFHKGRFTLVYPNGAKDEYRLQIGFETEPRRFDLRQMPKDALTKEQTIPLIYPLQESTTPGIYQLKGNDLRICIRPGGDWRRPKSFHSDIVSLQTIYTLRRSGK